MRYTDCPAIGTRPDITHTNQAPNDPIPTLEIVPENPAKENGEREGRQYLHHHYPEVQKFVY